MKSTEPVYIRGYLDYKHIPLPFMTICRSRFQWPQIGGDRGERGRIVSIRGDAGTAVLHVETSRSAGAAICTNIPEVG